MFELFLQAFAADADDNHHIDASLLTKLVEREFGVCVPSEIKEFWTKFGSGYFGNRMLYFFGDGAASESRDSLIEWNQKNFWPQVYPAPKDGGPVFFAETCFGDQLGFRWEGDNCLYILFCVDTFDAFVIAKSGTELFDQVLADRYSLVEGDRYDAVLNKLGPLQKGMHYAPFVSPMVGGTGDAENFCLESPNAHFRTAIATYQALHAK